MATDEQLIEALRQADAAGNTADAQRIAQMIQEQRQGASFQETAAAAEQGVNQAAQRMSPLQQLAGATGATVSGLSQGLTFGFSDELGAALGAPVAAAIEGDIRPGNIAENYRQGLEALRQQYAQQRQQFPLAFGASEVTGGLGTGATGVGALGATRGLVPAIRAGGVGGGIAGAGYADAETLGEFAGDVAGGAALGAAGGAALSAGGSALRRAGAEVGGLFQTPQRRAVRMLSQADPEFGAALDRAREQVAQGRPATAADFASRQAKAILRSAARRPSPGQDLAEQVLDQRSAGQYGRLQGAIDDAFDIQRSYIEEFDYLNQAKQAIAGDLYDTAFQQPTPITLKLQNVMQRPAMRRTLRNAQRIADAEGDVIDNDIFAAFAGAAREGDVADTRTLHYMRRSLDDQINALRDTTTGRFRQPEVARALGNLRRDFNEALIEENPAFREADKIWGGLERSRQAMEQGVRAAGRTNERGVRELLRRVDPQDRSFFEIGYAQGLNEKIGRSGSDFTNLAARLRSPEQQNSIRLVLGEQRARGLLDTIEAEDAFSRTRQMISPNVGSPTYELTAQDPAVSGLLNFIQQPISGIVRAADSFVDLGRAARRSQIDEQLLNLGVGPPAQAAQTYVAPPPQFDVTAPLAAGLSPLTVQLLRE